MTTLAVLKATLLGCSGRRQITVCVARSNRDRSETRDMVGCLVNMLAVPTELRPDRPFRELLGQVREAVLGGFANSDIPFEYVLRQLHGNRDLQNAFQVAFALLNAFIKPDVITRVDQIDTGTSKYELGLNLSRVGDRLEGFWEYDTLRFGPAEIARLSAGFQAMARLAADDPERSLRELVELAELHDTRVRETDRATREDEHEQFGI